MPRAPSRPRRASPRRARRAAAARPRLRRAPPALRRARGAPAPPRSRRSRAARRPPAPRAPASRACPPRRVVSAAAAAAAAAANGAGSGSGAGGGIGSRGCACPRLRSVGVRVDDHRLELAPVGRREVDRLRPPAPPSSVSSAASNASAASRCAAASSSTPKRGSSPAASGRLRSTRAQNPWIVPIQAASTARARSGSPSSLKRAADPLAQLGRRLLREGQRQDRADRDAVAQHRLGEALDHHGRLAGARAGGEQRRALAVGDRRALLGREPHAGGSLRGSPARQMAGIAAAAVRAALRAGADPARRAARRPCARRARARRRARRRSRRRRRLSVRT